jgi:hypothetical protein
LAPHAHQSQSELAAAALVAKKGKLSPKQKATPPFRWATAYASGSRRVTVFAQPSLLLLNTLQLIRIRCKAGERVFRNIPAPFP